MILRRLPLLLLLLLHASVLGVQARVVCTTTAECERAYLSGSECGVDGYCTNPFHRGGCFASALSKSRQQQEPQSTTTRRPRGRETRRRSVPRVCHSEDPPEAAQRGHCRSPDPHLEYAEIRILTQDWESVFLEAWLLQIVLTEVLGVPATIESGRPDVVLDFYRSNVTRGYGRAYDWDALRRGNALGDCRRGAIRDEEGAYRSCAHVLPEIYTNHFKQVQDLVQEGVLEQPGTLGVLGQQAWFVPKFTARKDPSLLTVFGLQGQRHKLAERFQRPTRWQDYCTHVSNTSCATPDGTAARAPHNDTEGRRFFIPNGLYNGYFRKTVENDCQRFPDTCSGHIADFPCGWLSTLEQQAYHLDIALRSSGPEPGSRGYPYHDLVDMMAAANATKSDFILQWWTPDVLYQQYLETDAALMRVHLPPPTRECRTHTIRRADRCSPDRNVRVGDARGACHEPPNVLQKVMVQSLRQDYADASSSSSSSSSSKAKRSPAHLFVQNFQLSALELQDMFDRWLQRGVDEDFDMRYAACAWLTEHWEDPAVQMWLPKTYPRVTIAEDEYQRRNNQNHVLFVISSFLAALALVGVVGTAVCIARQGTRRRVLKYAQVEFLWLLLAGLCLVAVGAILALVEPAGHRVTTCVLTVWLIHFGYTLELVPLIVKVAALTKLMGAAATSEQLKRVVVKKTRLFRVVAGLCAVIVAYLAIWTALDASRHGSTLSLTDDRTEFGETIVLTKSFCRSDSSAWRYTAMTWHFLLLMTATVLAFQARAIRTEFNESQELSRLIYSQFMFAVLRVITFSLETERNYAQILRFRSLTYSVDILNALAVYFWSKLLRKDNEVATPHQGMGISGLNISQGESHRILAQMRELSKRSVSFKEEVSSFMEDGSASNDASCHSDESTSFLCGSCKSLLTVNVVPRSDAIKPLPAIEENPESGRSLRDLPSDDDVSGLSIEPGGPFVETTIWRGQQHQMPCSQDAEEFSQYDDFIDTETSPGTDSVNPSA